jgi:PAS domain S-box-containing protein
MHFPTFKSAMWPLVLGMAAVAAASTGASILILYRTAHAQILPEMQESVSSLAGVMEAVARFDIRFSARTHPQGSWGATMSQIEQGLGEHLSSYHTAELIIGHRVGNTIKVTRRASGKGGTVDVATIDFDSQLAEPLRRALRGERGGGELTDYRGEPVLAGYAPVPSLQIGVVYKIDLAEVREGYVRAALWAGAVALLVIGLGAAGFRVLTRSAQRRADENKQAADLALKRLNEAQRLAKVGSWELDLVTDKLVWSDEIFRMFEIDQARFGATYEAFLNAIHPDDRDAVNKAYTASLADRKPYEIVHRLKMADGRVKYVRETCESFFDDVGKALRSVGTVQDITELHKAELELCRHREHLEDLVEERTARLAESERLLRRAQEIAHLGHWSVDLQTGTLHWSDEIYRIFGRDPSQFQPSYDNFFACVHPDDVALVKASEQESFQTGRHSVDHRVVRPDGAVRWVHEEAQLERDEAGKPLHLTGTVQDITDRKQAEAELVQAKDAAVRASQAKSEFLSRMSHELRTPMNAILGFAQVLELERLNPEQLDFVHEIRSAGNHLLELINELLDLSRIEAGKMAAVLQPVNVRSAVVDAVQIVQPLISARQIGLVNKCEARAAVLADPTRLKQILVNLLSNAAKYNRAGGRIAIDCRRHGEDRLRLSVTDSGPGIPPDKQEHLFKPFERLGAEHTTVDGTGIGLALSRQLAELMGASLGLHSTPGQGSTFWIDLPPAPESRATGTPALPDIEAIADTRQIKVLYVEDNPANLRVVEAMFRHQPHLMLLAATNGEFGLELARRYKPDVILLDIHLPGMDGYAVLEALKADATARDIPVIALSADAMPIDVETGLNAGFRRYLTKPVKAGALMEALGSVLSNRAAGMQ